MDRLLLLRPSGLLGWEDLEVHEGLGVLVADGRIAGVARPEKLLVPAEARPCEEVDLSGLVLMPGLINTHLHLEFSAGEDPLADYLAETNEARLVRALCNAQALLRSGVTTARDCGSSWTALALADPAVQQRAGLPRLQMCGPPLTVTGGHLHWMGEEADTTDELVRGVRLRRKRGAAGIKLVATGGQMTPGSGPEICTYTVEQMAAAVAEARRHRLPTVAHCLSAEGLDRALRAGVDSVEHCTFFVRDGQGRLERVYQDVAVEPHRERRPLFMSGLSLGWHWLDEVRPGGTREPTEEERFYLAQERRMFDIFLTLVRAGFRPVVGTDAGVFLTPFEETALELLLMEQGGLTRKEVLRAATAHSAAALGLGDTIGQIRAGYAADLVALRSNPLEGLGAYEQVDWIMRGGEIVKD